MNWNKKKSMMFKNKISLFPFQREHPTQSYEHIQVGCILEILHNNNKLQLKMMHGSNSKCLCNSK